MPKAKRKQLNIGITPDQYEAVRIAAEEEGADHHGLLPGGHPGPGDAGAGDARTWRRSPLGCCTSCYSSPGARHGPLCQSSSRVLGGFAMQRVA